MKHIRIRYCLDFYGKLIIIYLKIHVLKLIARPLESHSHSIIMHVTIGVFIEKAK